MKPTKLRRSEKRPDGWWIPRTPPHLMRACGPYQTKDEAEDDRLGMERTMNDPVYRSVVMDLEEEEGLDET